MTSKCCIAAIVVAFKSKKDLQTVEPNFGTFNTAESKYEGSSVNKTRGCHERTFTRSRAFIFYKIQ
jgi:hypothetical protein